MRQTLIPKEWQSIKVSHVIAIASKVEIRRIFDVDFTAVCEIAVREPTLLYCPVRREAKKDRRRAGEPIVGAAYRNQHELVVVYMYGLRSKLAA